jgi:hypothetical protein
MQRNTNILFLTTLGATTPISWVNNAPDFSAFTEPTLSVLVKVYNDFIDNGGVIEVIPDPEPYIEPVAPDWDGLQNEILNGSLRILYERLANHSVTNHQFSTPFTIITASILTVHTENSVREAVTILLGTGYEFLPEEIVLWNNFVSSIGFSEMVLLPE